MLRDKRLRPPERLEQFEILKNVADAYRDGIEKARETVADKHQMSDGALRDPLRWARHSANPPLFTNNGPGRRDDTLTPEALALIEEGVD